MKIEQIIAVFLCLAFFIIIYKIVELENLKAINCTVEKENFNKCIDVLNNKCIIKNKADINTSYIFQINKSDLNE